MVQIESDSIFLLFQPLFFFITFAKHWAVETESSKQPVLLLRCTLWYENSLMDLCHI